MHSDDPAIEAAELRLAVTRLSRRLRQHASGDASPSMVSAMSTIDRSGPLTLGELATVERVQPPSMTRIVAALEDRGFVSRESDPTDRRVSRVRLTPDGERFLHSTRTRKDAFLAGMLAALDPDDLDALRAAVPVLRRLAEQEPAPGRRR